MSQTILERIEAPGPKKILACDGGGILGLMSVEILAKIEAELRAKMGNADLVLADWFDFVCGTSTAPSSRPVFRSACRSNRSATFTCKAGR
jgi:uncharacterized protein